MKVIFLDVDGVLNCSVSRTRAPAGFIGVDDIRVKLLRQIVDATNAVIVLTSTWQKEWKSEGVTPSGKYLIRKLAKEKLRIYDRTGRFGDDRGYGIIEWMQKCPEDIDSWVVLDDEIFPDFLHQGIIPHLVQSNFYSGGLKQQHVECAIRMLNNDYDDLNNI